MRSEDIPSVYFKVFAAKTSNETVIHFPSPGIVVVVQRHKRTEMSPNLNYDLRFRYKIK